MGQKVRIFASRKWQLSLTLGGVIGGAEPRDKPGDRVAELEKPAGRKGPGLRIIWPDQAVQPDVVGGKSGPQS